MKRALIICHTTFAYRVLQVVSHISFGKTITYQEVARRAGSPKACRAVGNILHKNWNPKIPCHRVIRSDGTVGGYNRGENKKRQILHTERSDLKLLKGLLPNKSLASIRIFRLHRIQKCSK